MTRRSVPGVFCLETPWSTHDLADDSSVGPLLAVLEKRHVIRFIHRDAVTVEEFEHYLGQWMRKKYARYSVLYLAFHGKRGRIEVGNEEYTLERLAEQIAGRVSNRIIYFGSCSTLRISEDRALRFLKDTGARAICGYTRDVDWIESAAFDLNLMEALTRFERIGSAFRYLEREHEPTCARLGFRAAWKDGSLWQEKD